MTRGYKNYWDKRRFFYVEHKKLKISNKTVPKYFNDLYKRMNKDKNFDEFLKESYKTIKKHKGLFKI